MSHTGPNDHPEKVYHPPADYRHDLETQQDSKFRLLEIWEYNGGLEFLFACGLTLVGLWAIVQGWVVGGLFVTGVFAYIAQNFFCGLSSRFTCLQCALEHRRYAEGATPGLWGLAYDVIVSVREAVLDRWREANNTESEVSD